MLQEMMHKPIPNVVLTYRCVNRCAYCFSEGTRSARERQEAKELTLEEFDFYTELHKRADVHSIKLLGGEPFVHSQIEQILARCLDGDWFKGIVIFTSGFIPERYQSLLCDGRVQLVVNVNSPEDYPAGRYDLLMQTLRKLAARPVRLRLGYNIYRTDFNYKPIVELARALGCTHMRWTLAAPSYDGSTKCLDWEGRRRVIPRVLEFLEACERAELEPVLDCPFEPCHFTDAQLGAFARLCPKDVIRLGTCGPVMDLAPGYRALRCFAAGPAFSLDARDFTSLSQLFEQFKVVCEGFRKDAAPAYCRECRYFKFDRCKGGCVAANYAQIVKLKQECDTKTEIVPLANPSATQKKPALVRQAEGVVASGDEDRFLKFMDEHDHSLRHLTGTRRLWARYCIIKGDWKGAERYLHQAMLDESKGQVEEIRRALQEVRRRQVAAPDMISAAVSSE